MWACAVQRPSPAGADLCTRGAWAAVGRAPQGLPAGGQRGGNGDQYAGATELPTQRLQYFSKRYSRILREGRKELPLVPAKPAGQRGRVKQHKVKNLHDRLGNHKTEVLAFLYDISIPFTNNQGEQDVRMMKVKQKISGCFARSKEPESSPAFAGASRQ